MGRRSVQGLPPGMIARQRDSGTYYYLSRPTAGRREEIALGTLLHEALAEYKALQPASTRPLDDVGATARELHRRAKKGARQRGLEFQLTVDETERMLVDSGGRCAVTGILFDLLKPEGARKRLWAPSIDRIESAHGYVPGNVRVVAIAVNIAMSDFGEEFLLRIAHAIVRRNRASRQELRKSCGIAEVATSKC